MSNKSTKSSKSSKPNESKKSSKEKSTKESSVSKSASEKSTKSSIPIVTLFGPQNPNKVPVSDFVQVSTIIKQRQSEGRLADGISLREFSQETVDLFADYIRSSNVKRTVSFFVMAEMLKLSEAFIMEDLTKRLEENLILAAEASVENLLQSILVAGTTYLKRETWTAISYMAAWRFLHLTRLPNFREIPLAQFVQILGSCELNVAHEMVVADAALLWLAGQKNCETVAPAVFAMIRSAYLNKVDRNMIVERVSVLTMPDSVVQIARYALDSRHNARTCLECEHIQRHLMRCGYPEADRRPEESSLPLSRPRPETMWKKPEAKEKRPASASKDRKRVTAKVEKSDKSKKTTKSSGKSEKSEKTRSEKTKSKSKERVSKVKKSGKSGKSKKDKKKSSLGGLFGSSEGSDDKKRKKRSAEKTEKSGKSKKSSKSSKSKSEKSDKSSKRSSKKSSSPTEPQKPKSTSPPDSKR